MADKSSILTLNLGSQRVGMARFAAKGKGQLQLNAYAFSELAGDPATDSSRGPQLSAAVQSLTSQFKAAGQPVYWAVAGQPVLSKFVKLPPLGADKVDELIGFEAQQSIPFPIHEVCWDHQLLSSGQELGEMEAVLVAVKADALSELNAAVESAALDTEVVDVAPLALYNAFRFSYPDLASPALLIDLGARTTNLVYIEASGKVFFRTIPNVGGASITTSIAREMNLDFPTAEQRKVTDGFVSLQGYADHDDPDLAALSKVIRNALTRAHGEIVRTNNLYRTQQGGSAPEIVYLAGAGASLPYAKEFFEEKLNVTVEYFNPLRNVAIGPKVNAEQAQRDAHTMGELVGLALRGALACPMEIDLVPPSVGVRRDNASRKPALFLAAACLLGLLGAAAAYHTSAKNRYLAEKEKLAEKKLQLSGIDAKLTEQENIVKKEQARAEYLQDAVRDRTYWLELCKELNSKLPSDLVWVTQLQPMSNGKPVTEALVQGGGEQGKVPSIYDDDAYRKAHPTPKGAAPAANAAPQAIDSIHVFGLYRDYQNEKKNAVVNDFFDAIRKDTKFFVIDEKADKARYWKTESAAGDKWAYSFEMDLPLKRKIKVPKKIAAE